MAKTKDALEGDDRITGIAFRHEADDWEALCFRLKITTLHQECEWLHVEALARGYATQQMAEPDHIGCKRLRRHVLDGDTPLVPGESTRVRCGSMTSRAKPKTLISSI